MEPVQGGLQPAEWTCLSGYARSRQAAVVTRPRLAILIPPPGRPELQYQPHSSLVTCNAGEKVLLRFANLGFREAAMTLAGLTVKVVGRDATPMNGRDGTDTSYETDTLLMGAGESYDAIFTAPANHGTWRLRHLCSLQPPLHPG